jgi:hypothetical protein
MAQQSKRDGLHLNPALLVFKNSHCTYREPQLGAMEYMHQLINTILLHQIKLRLRPLQSDQYQLIQNCLT